MRKVRLTNREIEFVPKEKYAQRKELYDLKQFIKYEMEQIKTIIDEASKEYKKVNN